MNRQYTDYIHKSEFLKLLAKGKFDNIEAIIHMGACSSTAEKNADYLMENNFRYSVSLAEFAIKNNIRFINASSAATYGDGSAGFSDSEETMKNLKPLNMYGYRGGVINRDLPYYIKGWSEFDFISGSVEALRGLTRSGYAIIVITNQSAIPRKLISLQELDFLHSRMKEAIESKGGKVKDIFICHHLPSAGCDCRKPSPGLIYQVQRKYDIDLTASMMIGDSFKDIQCAHHAGCVGRAGTPINI